MPTVRQISLVVLLAMSVGVLFLDRSVMKQLVALTVDDAETTLQEGNIPPCATINTTTTTTNQSFVGNDVAIVRDSRSSNASPFAIVNRTDWFQGKLWQDVCMEVDHVCHSTGRWWYKTDNVPANARQPNLTFIAHKEKTKVLLAYPSHIPVRPATEVVKNLTCPYSPLPNHLVLYSLYNEMLGEFYFRVQVGLNYVMHQQEDMQAVLDSTQVYLQLYNFDRKLLDSHHAFLAPYLSHQLLDFKVLLQSTSCTCMERLVLCGYKFEKTDDGSDILVRAASGIDPKYYKRPEFKRWDPRLFRDAYNYLQEKVILNNPMIQQDIAAFRKKVLTTYGVADSFDEWKIVGLTQRTSRRLWANIDATMRMCNKFRLKRVLCIVVNVEKPDFYPTHHVVVHGSLDALIGIHGAQMTEALWMKPGSLVLEILPYLPPGVTVGSWTRWVNSATPLGAIYLGTELYHMGLPLHWNSIPQCATKKGSLFVQCCKQHKWDSRDFAVNPEDIEDVISNFIVNRPDSCDKQNELAGEERFVLYNVQCDDGSGKDNHSFLWPKNLEQVEKFLNYPGSK